MAGAWFESVAEARRRAQRRLPDSVYMAIWAGSEHGLTLKDNVGAFDELASRRTSRVCTTPVSSRPP
jgi:hypothetical protein